jgi:hypothetical protein
MHKAMGGGSISLWHKQQNEPTIALATQQINNITREGVNGDGGYVVVKNIQQCDGPQTCHLQGGDKDNTLQKHM